MGQRGRIKEITCVIDQDQMLYCPGVDGCDFFEQGTFLVLSCHRDIATAPVGIEPYQGRPAQLWHQGRKHVLALA